MSGKTGLVACTSSTNELEFAFPYSGGSYGKICLRKGPQFANGVYIRISKGQILCSGYSGCHLRVRFDDGIPFVVDGVGPSDGSTTIVFLQGYAGLVAKMKRAKSMMVEVEFYQNGRQILSFDVSDLRWD